MALIPSKRVFISYSTDGKRLAERAQAEINQSINIGSAGPGPAEIVLLDNEARIPSTVRLVRRIERLVARSAVFVLVVARSGSVSNWANTELAFAISHKVPVVVYLEAGVQDLPGCVPEGYPVVRQSRRGSKKDLGHVVEQAIWLVFYLRCSISLVVMLVLIYALDLFRSTEDWPLLGVNAASAGITVVSLALGIYLFYRSCHYYRWKLGKNCVIKGRVVDVAAASAAAAAVTDSRRVRIRNWLVVGSFLIGFLTSVVLFFFSRSLFPALALEMGRGSFDRMVFAFCYLIIFLIPSLVAYCFEKSDWMTREDDL